MRESGEYQLVAAPHLAALDTYTNHTCYTTAKKQKLQQYNNIIIPLPGETHNLIDKTPLSLKSRPPKTLKNAERIQVKHFTKSFTTVNIPSVHIMFTCCQLHSEMVTTLEPSHCQPFHLQ